MDRPEAADIASLIFQVKQNTDAQSCQVSVLINCFSGINVSATQNVSKPHPEFFPVNGCMDFQLNSAPEISEFFQNGFFCLQTLIIQS